MTSPANPQILRELSARSEIASFIVMDVMSAAAAAEADGRDVVHMEVGQPGTSAPEAARKAAALALEQDRLGYTLATGNVALRQRIAQHYKERYGVTVPYERIVVTSGSSAGFVLAFLSLFDTGAGLALPSPGYPCYRQVATALGLNPVLIETSAADRWMPTEAAVVDALDKQGAAGLLLASPANPTGTMLSPERLEALVGLCTERAAWFISDEIYHGLAYDVPEQTALAFSDDVIVINSFSKYFSMTGWRVGWMVVPEAVVPAVERLTQNLYISAPAISQAAALGAFDGIDELEANKAVYAANRRILLDGLPRVGIEDLVPADGAFYLYADVSRFTNDSLAFAKAMLDEAGIAATPGLDFDSERGGRYIRFSYAGTEADMKNGLDRLANWDRLKR
jgi:aspartate/methionine/tyrosine aminotransferase